MDKQKLFDIYNDKKSEAIEWIVSDVKSGNKDDHVLLIDGLNLFFRTWSVNPSMNDNGDHVGGVVGSLRSLGAAIRDINPTRCVIVWDGKGGSQRRRKLHPGYKANRKPNKRLNRTYEDMMSDKQEEASMRRQIVSLIGYLQTLPMTLISIDSIEADDVIAYATTNVLKDKVTIMSTDKDFIQLVNDKVSVWNPTQKIMYTPEVVLAKKLIPAHNYLMFRIMDGDASDEIAGIKGAGLKTLVKRIPILTENRSVSIEDVLQVAEDNKGKYKLFNTILDNADKLTLNYKLMQLSNVDISGINKMKIVNKLGENNPKLNKIEFIRKLREDRMEHLFKNFHTWVKETFTLLNSYI